MSENKTEGKQVEHQSSFQKKNSIIYLKNLMIVKKKQDTKKKTKSCV